MTIGIIDWDPPNKVCEHYKDKTLVELLELYDASVDEEGTNNDPGTVLNKYDYENASLEIASRLNLIPLSVANACVEAEFATVYTKLNELEEIAKKHRHKTLAGLYTEKPAW